MKKVITYILFILIFFIIYFLQFDFFNWFTIAGIKPNIFIIYIAVIGSYSDKIASAVTCITFGMYLDIINGKCVGETAFLFVLVAIISKILNKNISRENRITLLLNIILVTILYEFLNYIFMCIKLASQIEFLSFAKILVIELLFNTIITIILYPIIQKTGKVLKSIFENDKMFSI